MTDPQPGFGARQAPTYSGPDQPVYGDSEPRSPSPAPPREDRTATTLTSPPDDGPLPGGGQAGYSEQTLFSVGANGAGYGAQPAPSQPAPPAYASPAEPIAAKKGRKTAWIVGGAVVLVIAAAAGVGFAMSSSRTDPAADRAAITDITNKVLKANVAGDTNTALALSTGALRDKIVSEGLPSDASGTILHSVKVNDIVVTGDKATATARIVETPPGGGGSGVDIEHYEYQRTGSGWKVSLNPKGDPPTQN